MKRIMAKNSMDQNLDLTLRKQEWNKLNFCLGWEQEDFGKMVKRRGLTRVTSVSLS
jgi:hypothetical protein